MRMPLLRFLTVGVISTIVNYTSFVALLYYAHIQYQVASACAFALGLVVGFPLNKSWTYQDKSKTSFNVILRYITVYTISILVSTISLYILIKKLHTNTHISEIISISITTIINFIGTKCWVFRVRGQ